MSRYIDADEFEDELYEHEFSNWCDKDEVSELIDNMPSADVDRIRHGYWERDGHHIRCSECGTYFCITDREGDSFPINYCPCCGAKMDKGVAHRKEQEHEDERCSDG